MVVRSDESHFDGGNSPVKSDSFRLADN